MSNTGWLYPCGTHCLQGGDIPGGLLTISTHWGEGRSPLSTGRCPSRLQEAVGPHTPYSREHSTCPTRCAAAEPGSRTARNSPPFHVVLQQMLTEAEVSPQEGCVQKVGELLRLRAFVVGVLNGRVCGRAAAGRAA